MNQVVIVGRMANDAEVETLESGKKVTNINLAVSRNYKNEEGVYETDFIKCTLWNEVAERTAEYVKKGDILGVKGRLQTDTYTDKETGKNRTAISVIAEKVTFLSSRTNEKHDVDQER